MEHVALVPIYLHPESEEILELGRRLGAALQVPTKVVPAWFDPEVALDRRRRQHDSTRLLAALLDHPPTYARWLLGVTDVDLCIPILTYVFGEAQLDGRAAVVSTHRLHPELYGLGSDQSLVLDRLEKEALHELGHTFGLKHCAHPACVMRTSTYVEDIDIKAARFCLSCTRTAWARLHGVPSLG